MTTETSTTAASETTERPMHPFERAGLGKAPFRYVGYESLGEGGGLGSGLRKIGEVGGGIAIATTPGGSCHYCGQFIIDAYNVASADGKRFHVGSDCVRKIRLDDAALAAKVDTAAKKLARAKRHARDAAKAARGRDLLADETVRAKLAAHRHPLNARAEKGETLLDWAERMMERAGASGKVRATKTIELALSRI